MKKVLFFLIFCLFSCQGYTFWIWSPKTQKWKNPNYSPLATPYLQYREALKLFEEENYKDAYHEFKKLIVHYPDAREAAEAQYHVARCLEKLDKPYEAFLEYKKIADTYPNSQRISEVAEREYSIGEFFLNREHKKWLGFSVYDFVEHPSVEIFKTIVDKSPYSEYAPRAQYKLGIIFIQLGRYDEARDAFQKVLDNYPDSEWAAPSKYQLAIATAKAFPGADYDSSYLEEATDRLDEFIKAHPEAQISSQAQDQLDELRDREARKNFDIAEFYYKQDHFKSAVLYYQKIVTEYPDSSYYETALEKAQELDELIRGDISKSEFEKMRKRQEAEIQQAEKTRAREEKIRRKKELKEQKKQEKLLLIKQRKEEKDKIRQEKIAKIQAAKAEKQALIDKKRSEKKALAEKKLQERQELIRAKKQAQELKRQEKLRRIEEKEKQKEALRQEKLRRIEAKKKEKEAARQEKLRIQKEKKELEKNIKPKEFNQVRGILDQKRLRGYFG
ncbi:MAG: outer membrane protein assembly factor BamD [Candidatus Omnitrophica bacterium]|nr:outer membrane protein assembly factor BamD [Candidatus Omnitrophota bacterium]MDD5429234.1 outer membrane protein assembly factor BamD [Candidatus Omnitrophota bacterium]